VSESVNRLGEVSRAYDLKANTADEVYTAAAEAEATHKHEHAKAVLRFKESGERMSQGEAETRADADDEIAKLYRDKVVTKAKAEALKAKLTQMREQQANGRTAVVDERGVDEGHARGYGGHA
jgi:hypothetical protein